MNTQKLKTVRRQRKRFRVRKKVQGTAERPRLSVFRSVKHIYAQLIDDLNGKTLASASTMAMEGAGKAGGNVKGAAEVGTKLAEAAKAAFDRGHYKYHGRVKALADAARAGGIQF